MRILAVVVLGVGVLGASARAQAPGAKLTELDQLRRENAYLQARLARTLDERDECRVEFAPSRKQRDDAIVQRTLAKLKADIEAAHACCTFNIETGALESKPEPPSAAPKPQP